MTRTPKAALIVGACLILYSLIGFFILPLALESILPEKLSAALDRKVSVENIRINPFALTAAVEGLDIQDKTNDAAFVSLAELFVNVETVSLFKPGLVVKEARLVKPLVRIVRTGEAEFNFSDLLAGDAAAPEPAPPPPAEPKTPFRFSVSNIHITDGAVQFQDDVAGKAHALSALNFTVPHLSNFEKHVDTFSEPLLTADFNDAGISMDVDTKPFHDTLETIVHLTIKGLEIPHYLAYVPEHLKNFDIPAGRLDATAQVSFKKINDQSDVVLSGELRLADLAITDKNAAQVFTLPSLKVTVAPSRPLKNQLTLERVTVEAPAVSVIRDAQGVINLTTLGPSPGPAETAEDTPLPEEAEAAPEPKTPFVFAINDLSLEAGKLGFTDFAAPGPDAQPTVLTVNDLQIHMAGFSTAPETAADYQAGCRINSQAPVAISGSLGISPLAVTSDFDIEDLPLAWGQPYLPKTIGLTIADGKFSASGHAQVHAGEDGNVRTSVSGKAAVTDLDTLDTAQKEKFLSWESFSLNGINLSTDPMKLHLDDIRLAGLKNQVVVLDDGRTNLQTIFAPAPAEARAKEPEPEPTPAPEKAAPPPMVSIGEVALENCDFTFVDRKIQPHFKTRFNLAELTVTGLTSENFKTAALAARGAIDDHAPVAIQGALNPLAEDLFADLAFTLSDMDLSTFSPYTGTYIGRAIAKGKLSTDIRYKIDHKDLSAQNRILLDQFTLGQTVESKDALNLPVGVAIALLKDRSGKIQVDLPISGRTDDPEFKFGKALVRALTNLVVKAATAPFDLVGSLVGGGEELRYIEFAAADAGIAAPAAEKLASIGKLLYERPGLKLDLAGYADPEADRAALARRMVDRRLKSRYLGKNAPADPAGIDQAVIPPEDYPKVLKQAYAEALAADPELQKTAKAPDDPAITLDEMKSLLVQETPVPDAELRLLARERVQSVKTGLLADGNVSPDRIFLTEPQTLAPKKKDKFSAARVELNLK